MAVDTSLRLTMDGFYLYYLVEMALISGVSFTIAIMALVITIIFPAIQAPAPAPTNDGKI